MQVAGPPLAAVEVWGPLVGAGGKAALGVRVEVEEPVAGVPGGPVVVDVPGGAVQPKGLAVALAASGSASESVLVAVLKLVLVPVLAPVLVPGLVPVLVPGLVPGHVQWPPSWHALLSSSAVAQTAEPLCRRSR